MTNSKLVMLENLWIDGQETGFSFAGLSILGGQGSDYNTYAFRVLGCDFSGCEGDGISLGTMLAAAGCTYLILVFNHVAVSASIKSSVQMDPGKSVRYMLRETL
jgi:hypothetical protein